jgi:Protein of unknown function (DUF2793)
MPTPATGRHQLPFLAVAQAQKELTHNEALARIDALLHPAVEQQRAAPPSPTNADIGKCWLIAAGATEEWAGKSGQLATWIDGGWRYLIPVDAMRIRLKSNATDLIWSGSGWITAPIIANPIGGSVVDVESRAAIAALLSYFRMIGQFTV